MHPLVLDTKYVLDEWVTEDDNQWKSQVLEIMGVAYFWIMMGLFGAYTYGYILWIRSEPLWFF